MENLHESGKIYFFRTQVSEKPSESFGPLLEVNSNFDILKSLHISGTKALGITSNNELLEWEFNPNQKANSSKIPAPSTPSSQKSKINKKKDYYFLLFKPSYHFHKIKFLQISVNKTMCLGLDVYHNVLVWGQNKEGLLGLGFDITSIEVPTIIPKLKEIKEISLSDYHAVALNNNGNAFSWGLGKYGELGLERSIYTPTPLPILTDTIYSKVFCGNLLTCFLDVNGKFYYYGIVIKQLGGYGNISTLKSLLNDQNYNDGKNIYFEKEIEEIENESFKNIVIGNGFVALLTKNGLLYVLEYNNKLSLLHSKFFLYHITVAYNDIYGLARERPKKDKNIKDNYYLFKWNSKSFSENDLSSDIWQTTIWKFKDNFQLISNCKLLDTNNNKNILLLKDQDEKYNLTNSIFNPHRKNTEFSAQNSDVIPLDKSVNNLNNISSFGDLVINKKILPEKFLEYFNQYDDNFNIKYKKCKLKLNKKTGIDNSSFYNNNNNKSRTLSPFLKISQGNNVIGNNKNSGSLSPYLDNNISHNNNLFSESYNAQLDLGKENDNVNIYKPDDEDDIIDVKEKELNKYRNEVDNIINNFKIKKESNNNSINNTNKNQIFNTSQKNNNIKNKSNSNSNQNERYSLNRNDNSDLFYGNNFLGLNPDNENYVGRNKLKLSKEEMINIIKMDIQKKEKENISNYNDALSRVRNNIINVKDKIKFKDNTLNKICNLFTLNEEESEEETEKNYEKDDKNKNVNSKNKKKQKQKNKIIIRSPSFSKLRSKRRKYKNNLINAIDDNNNNNSKESFINIEDLDNIYKRRRYNSKDNILLKDKNDEFNENYYNNFDNNIGLKYISGNNSINNNGDNNHKKNNFIKEKEDNKYNNDRIGKTKLRGANESRKNNNNDNYNNENDDEYEEEEEEEEYYDENNNNSSKEKMKLIKDKKIIKNKHNNKNKKNNQSGNESQNDDENNINKISKNKIIKNKNINKNDLQNEEREDDDNYIEKENSNKNHKKLSKKSKTKIKGLNNKLNNKEQKGFDEKNELEEDEEDENDEIEFFDEIDENNNKIKKIKNIKGNKKIKIKKTNSISNINLDKILKPKIYEFFEDTEQDMNNINSNKKKYSNSLDKIDKRKSLSNLLIAPNRIYNKINKIKKKAKKNNINNLKNSDYNEEEEEDDENEEKINNNKNMRNIKNKKMNNSKNKNYLNNDINRKDSNNNINNDEFNEYDDEDNNNEITFKKKIKNSKNKIINKKGQINTGKSKNNLIDNNTNSNESDNNNMDSKNINKISNKYNANKLRNKNLYNENSKEDNNNKMLYLKMSLNGIKINKFSLMYFCELIDHYMKKKSFGICARQIANYQKYLEIKFSLKILFRVLLKRIIFYKIKFMHRYKKINKYLIKNKIKNIKSVYKNNK